jgi:signal transduction histidine kinase
VSAAAKLPGGAQTGAPCKGYEAMVMTLNFAASGLRLLVFAGIYGMGAWLSSQTPDAPMTATSLVWAPAGIAMVGFFVCGPEMLWGVGLGSLVVHLWAHSSPTELVLETASAMLCPWLAVGLTRWAQLRPSLARFYDVLVLTFICALGYGLMDGTLTVLGRMIGEGRPLYPKEWLCCVLADALGVLSLAPATLVWKQHVRLGTTSWVEGIEVALFSLALSLATMVLWRLPTSHVLSASQGGLFLLMPALLWGATRFGQRGVVTALGVSCIWALSGTFHERELFWAQRLADADRIVALQLYLCTGMLSVLVFGSIIEERRQAIRLRDDFLIVASHELKTPLTALMLGVENLQRRLQREEGERCVGHRKKLKACHAQVDRLAALVDGLLDVSRLSGRRLHLHRQPADLAAIVAPILEEMRPRALSVQAELQATITEGLWGLWDCERIQQLVRALLDNACKYGSGHPIVVRLEHKQGQARLCVADQGIGIAPRDVERIFCRFERAVSAQYYGGMGLGLFVARKIARAHGGSLWVRSKVGEGSQFYVSLPRRQGFLAKIFYANRKQPWVGVSQSDGFRRD